MEADKLGYQSTLYWEYINREMYKRLWEGGYENFKTTSAVLYNDDYKGNLEKQDLDIKELWGWLYANLPGELVEAFSEPLEGSPIYTIVNFRPVTLDLGCSLREYWILSQRIDFNSIKSITEIGGGYGRLAYVISKLHPSIKYTMIDIEPSISLACRYLKSVCPGGLFEFKTPDLLSGKTDLLIAVNCLHEMKPEHVNQYFDYADKNAEYFYYSCWNEGHVPFDNLVWKKEDYPVKDSWKLLLSQPHVRQGFFEELYKI